MRRWIFFVAFFKGCPDFSSLSRSLAPLRSHPPLSPFSLPPSPALFEFSTASFYRTRLNEARAFCALLRARKQTGAHAHTLRSFFFFWLGTTSSSSSCISQQDQQPSVVFAFMKVSGTHACTVYVHEWNNYLDKNDKYIFLEYGFRGSSRNVTESEPNMKGGLGGKKKSFHARQSAEIRPTVQPVGVALALCCLH